ncbi:MarR family winged helix-turn-helix transcriptional regulator [Paucidesulfovibrio longus]|uniref:MarR family winged helix-turn-helix transcriptional regulator n=1 Tax=Paucidesulfovibrio longus TaxID=889 RepID=UPI0003B3419E|nr:MarR family transcriptional regulator [Paucidesulfovibrio longus]
MSSSYEQSPCSLAGALARLHVQAVQARLAPHKATAAEFPVLQCLWQRDGQTQSELCRSLSVEQPTLANTLNRMVRDNLVRKTKDTNDRRQVIIKLTRRGRELENVLSGSVDEVLAAAEQGLSAEEVRTYLELTRRMMDNLRQDLDQTPVVLDESLALAEEAEPTSTPPRPEEDAAEEEVLVLGDEYEVEA